MPNILNLKKNEKGQTLYEVIIAIGIVSLILVGAVSLSTTSLRNSAFARNNTLATKFAQEGSEFVRQQRDLSWSAFYSQANGSPRNMGNLSWPPGRSCNVATAATFCRTVTLTRVSNDVVNALINVNWTDGQGTHHVRSATTYTRWK